MTPRLKNTQRNCMTYLEKFPNVFRGQCTSLYVPPKIEEDVMSTLMQWERLHILYLQELYILCVLIYLYLSFMITFEKTKILQHTSSNYDNKGGIAIWGKILGMRSRTHKISHYCKILEKFHHKCNHQSRKKLQNFIKKRKRIIANFLYNGYALYTRVMRKCTMVCKWHHNRKSYYRL